MMNWLKELTGKAGKSLFFVGSTSLLWLVVRSGLKPTRMAYPCQQAAALNLGLFSCAAAFYFHNIIHILKHKRKILLKYCLGISVIVLLIISLVPKGLSISSPHRVVSVYDSRATNWTYCTSGCPYYGDDAYIDQTIVDRMIDRGMMELTGASTIEAAWTAILPLYQSGEKIAIKVNFNTGGSYTDNDAYLDAIPQPINSIIRGLKSIGVQETDIWIFDATRFIPNRFRTGIHYPNIKYFDHYGNGADVSLATFDSADPSAQITFTNTTYTGSHQISDVLINARYLINIPLFKRHGGTGITLTLKNHLGSINGFYSGSHSMHNYIYLGGSQYSSSKNLLVDINNNTHIKNKTVLIVGDALYGAWPDNNQPPRRWTSFGSDSPNMFFFAVDPVAVDSVMYDYLRREGSFDAKSEDILTVAAQAGLGIHELWNNNTDRKYSAIDYLEINLNDLTPDTTAPTIAVTSPANGATVNNASLRVSGTAADNAGLSKVEARVGSGSWQSAVGTTSWNTTVTLSLGENTISVQAIDTSNNIKVVVFTVIYAPTTLTEVDGRKANIYPNPYTKGKGSTGKMLFGNLPKEATITIYKLTGEVLENIEHKADSDGGTAEWKIQDGIMAGVYLYVIDSAEGQIQKGKISIIK
ncbi:MAG: DUF362 domain-containing protein [Elusimicrobiota bacterium]